MSPARTFRGPAVCAAAGCTYRQLDYWARTNLARPSVTDPHGSGTVRRYSYNDLILIRIIVVALEAGWSLQRTHGVIGLVREHLDNHNDDQTWIVLSDTTSAVSTDLTEALANAGHVITILNLTAITDDLDAKLTQLTAIETTAS